MRVFGYDLNWTKAEKDLEPAVKRDGESPITSAVWGDVRRPGGVLTNAYQQVVWVYRAVNALAEQVANIPFRVSRSAGRPLCTHPDPPD